MVTSMVIARYFFNKKMMCAYAMMSITCNLFAVTVTLQVPNLFVQEDQSGKKVAAVYVDTLFKVKVTLADKTDRTSKVDIEGLDTLRVHGRSEQSHVFMKNGVLTSSVTYIYDVSTSQQGTYTLGPAWVTDNGNRVESNTLTFEAVKQLPGQTPQPNNQNKSQTAHAAYTAPEVLCQISTDKNSYVVGEPIELNVKVMFRGNILNIAEEKPKFAGFIAKEVEQQREYRQELDGKAYAVSEKKWILFPLNSGDKKIDPITIMYVYPLTRAKKAGGVFDDFFGGFFDQPRAGKEGVQSNALTIAVSDLPQAARAVDGIGTFQEFTGAIDKQEAVVNEPIVLRYTLQGRGNLDQITDLNLILPSHIRYYKSKVESKDLIDIEYKGTTKTFEYIIQVPRQGTVTIPQQQFTYFDTSTMRVNKLSSEPLSLTINPANDGGEQYVEPKAIQPEEKNTVSPGGQTKSDIHFIEENVPLSENTPRKLPWWSIIILLIFPFIISIGSFLKKGARWLGQRIFSRHSNGQSLNKLEKQLDLIIKKSSAEQLYLFFMTCFALKAGVEAKDISEAWISHYLANDDWGHQKIDEFLGYLSDCAAISFAAHRAHEEQLKMNSMVCKRAKYWFLLLKK